MEKIELVYYTFGEKTPNINSRLLLKFDKSIRPDFTRYILWTYQEDSDILLKQMEDEYGISTAEYKWAILQQL